MPSPVSRLPSPLRLVSLNIWDLPVALPLSDRERRLQDLADRLPALQPDIVVLQEAFRPAYKRFLADRLGFHTDPMIDLRRSVRGIPMDGTGGLTTLSRFPVTDARFVMARRIPGMKLDERIGRKGWLWTTLATPQGPLPVANVHLYAGTEARDARVRVLQLRQLLRDVPPAGPVIMAGDFNMARGYEFPGSGPTGFDVMDEAGWPEVAGGLSDGIATMAPSVNRWGRYVPWHRPDRRLTQVFVRGLTVAAPPELCLHQPPVSDHFGLLIQLVM